MEWRTRGGSGIGGLWNVKVDELNHHLRRSLHTKDGEYRVPLELVLRRLRRS